MSERLDTCCHALRGHIPRSDDRGEQVVDDSGFARKRTEELCDGRGHEDLGLAGREPCCDHGRGSVATGADVPRLGGPVPAQWVVNQRIDIEQVRMLTWCP